MISVGIVNYKSSNLFLCGSLCDSFGICFESSTLL